MKQMNSNELEQINGGASIKGTVTNAAIKFGRFVGTGLRKIIKRP